MRDAHPPSKKLFWVWGWAVIAWVFGLGCVLSRPTRIAANENTVAFTAASRAAAGTVVFDITEDDWARSLKENARSARPFSDHPLRSAWELLGHTSERNLTLNYIYDPRNHRLVGDDATRGLHLDDTDGRLAKEYRAWCDHGRRQPGDCLGVLEDRSILSSEGRFAIALTFALGASVIQGTENELRSLTHGGAILTTVISTTTFLLIILSMPEPITKVIAAIMATATICYLGYDLFYRVIDGWIDLTQAAGAATTFTELRQAGETYGRLLGEKAARFFIMLSMAAMGSSASQVASKIQKLPGFSQAAAAGAKASGINLAAALDRVQVVTVSQGEVSISMLSTAVTMTMDDALKRDPALPESPMGSRPQKTGKEPPTREAGQPSALRPEKGYLEHGKHGIHWTEGAANAKGLRKPQGQWGSVVDLEFAAQKAATLKVREYAIFDLPKGHQSFVWRVDGTKGPANRIWVRNNGTGTFHGFPME